MGASLYGFSNHGEWRTCIELLPFYCWTSFASVPSASSESYNNNTSFIADHFLHQHLIFLCESHWDFSLFTWRNFQHSHRYSCPTVLHSFNLPLQAPFSLFYRNHKVLITFHHFRFILRLLSLTFFMPFIWLSSHPLLLREQCLLAKALS